MMQAYDIARSYEWNYSNVPEPSRGVEIAPYPAGCEFCGIPVNSPIGVPAGPLLNSRWIFYYAALGFDVLTYKTVRSSARACFDLPNLLPVAARQPDDRGCVEAAADLATRSWAISFGMPSRDPSVWRDDVSAARRGLAKGQVLVVSVVASPQPGWNVEQIAADFALCARWAADSGAQVIEANLSCPNVCTAEGDLYQSPEASGAIAQAVRQAVPELSLVLKIGRFGDSETRNRFVRAVDGYATALSTANGITATVADHQGRALFEGRGRGIGGDCIRTACLEELRAVAEAIRTLGAALRIVGVGGISTAADVRARLNAGAHHVQIATAAMLNPEVGLKIRADLAAG